MAAVETCWRCGEEMRWVHGTWQCPRCKLKLGCCEGAPPHTQHATFAKAGPPLPERRP